MSVRTLRATLSRWAMPVRTLLGVVALVLMMTPLPGAAQDATTGPDAAAPVADAGPLQALRDVLGDEAARQALLDALDGVLGDAASPEAASDAAAPATPAMRPSLGARIAELTQGAAETIAGQFDDLSASLSRSGSVFEGLSGGEITVLVESVQSLFLVILITLAVFLGLRTLIRPVYMRMGRRAEDSNILRTGLIFAGSTALDAGIVIAAWALGYAITLLALGDYAQMGFRQALYLNAFLLVELVKVGVRAILSPSAAGLRPVALSDAAARRLSRHVNVVVSVLGYGQLLVVPIVNRNVSFAAGLGIAALLSVIVLLYIVVLVMRHRAPVAQWLGERLIGMLPADTPDAAVPDYTQRKTGGTLGTLIRSWHWLTFAYLAFMLVVVVSRPTWVVIDYLTVSLQVFAVILLGSVALNAMGRSLKSGVRLPEDLALRLPLLEPRLNSVVPKFLYALRLLVALGIVGFTVDAVGLVDVGGWMKSDLGLDASGRLVAVTIILLIAALIWLSINSWVDYQLNPEYGSVPSARQTTLLTLARNAGVIVLIILTLMFTLSEIGLDIGPLIASAGVLGLAIGFGAQKLVQDIITGIFIQFDNAMNVGDVVSVGGTTGVVEKLTVRSVALRDLSGTYHIIPFSSVDMVSNYMRDFAYFVADMGIAYREDIDEARKAMFDGFEELMRDPEMKAQILGEMEWFGLNSFGDSAVVLRARIKTLPGKQWGVGRAYNGIIKRIFDERGIEIPFPHQTLYFGETKDGQTQQLRLRDDTKPEPQED